MTPVGADGTGPALTLPQLLWPQSDDDMGGAERIAYLDGTSGQVFTYLRMRHEIRQMATRWRGAGLATGTVVTMTLPNGPEFVVAYHSILAAGGIVQPLDPWAPAAELHRAMDCSRPRFAVLTRPAWARLANTSGLDGMGCVILTGSPNPPTARKASRTTTWDIFRSRSDAQPLPAATIPTRAHDTAVLLSTSGTEGLPKNAQLSHHNLVVNLRQIHAVHRLSPGEAILSAAPLRHIYGMQMVMNHALLSGATFITMTTPFDLDRFLTLVRDHRVAVAYLSPPTIAALANEPAVRPHDLVSLRLLVSGGAPLDKEIAGICARRVGVPVIQGFGMTEAGCTHLIPDGTTCEATTIGPPLPYTKARIIDPVSGEVLGAGTPGELQVYGPQIGTGYLDDPRATAALFTPDGWLRTGDFAQTTEDGMYYIVGRRKEVIKYKGHQVAPAVIEAILHSHPAVADAAVIGIPDPTMGELPKALVVLRYDFPLEEIVAFVERNVAPHEKIRLIEVVDNIPRSPTGKIQRHKLAQVISSDQQRIFPSPDNVPDLRGKTVVVTGATRGFGRAIADALVATQANLVITGRDPGALAITAAQLGASGTRVHAAIADVTEPDSVTNAIDQARQTFGTIDVLINNAAVPGPIGPTWEVDEEQWWHAMEVNVRGTLHTCRSVIPHMIKQNGGRIINLVSHAGQTRWPYVTAYAVSKAAVIKLTENLAPELRSHRVQVFAYHPGMLDIGLTRNHLEAQASLGPWADRIARWARDQRDAGQFTPLRRALGTLLQLVDGTADSLSGRYLTADDDIAETIRKA